MIVWTGAAEGRFLGLTGPFEPTGGRA